GRNWKARFSNDGASFIPFLGSDAPRDSPVVLRVTAVRVGDRALTFAQAVAPERTENTIRYTRGSFEERYEARLEGLEQRFVLQKFESRDDMVVPCAFEGEPPAREADGAIQFSNERGGVRLSDAVALDARGRTMPIVAHLRNGAIELCVPA